MGGAGSGVGHESEPHVSAADNEALPPIVVLIVEERARAADQLAQLLRFWGAAAAHPLPRLDDVIAYLEQHTAPALILLDHRLHSHTCADIVLWLAARPALRTRLRVIAYTNAGEDEVMQCLRARIGLLAQNPTLVEHLLGRAGTPERIAVERLINEAMISEPTFTAFYRRLYDAYLSKRLSLHQVRAALHPLAHSLTTDR